MANNTHEAVDKNETVKEVVLEKHLLPEDKINKILNPSSLAFAHHLKEWIYNMLKIKKSKLRILLKNNKNNIKIW